MGIEKGNDQLLEPTAGHPSVDVHRRVVIGENRRADGRELALGAVDRAEDLVTKLELDRTPERGELAARRTRANQVIERLQ